MPEPELPPQSATVSELMDAATRVFRLTLAKCLPVAMFAVLCASMPDLYWLTTGKPMDFLHPPLEPKFWMLTALGFALYQFLAAMLMLRQRAILTRATPNWQRECRMALARWPLLLLTSLLAFAVVFTGALALLIPGIFALVCFLVLRPVVLFESLSPIMILRRCVRMTTPMWTKVMASGLIALLIVVVCTLAAAAGLSLLQAVIAASGAPGAAVHAFGSACGLGIQAVALVYFNALWLVLYSAASSSA